jgi:hypothetical protein
MRIVIGRISSSAVALVALAVLGLPRAGSAQSLGEAAERAKKERKGTKTKVITENELRRAGGGAQEAPVTAAEPADAPAEAPAEATTTEGGSVSSSEGGAASAAPARTEKTEDELRAEAQAAWRDRMQKAQADVARLNTEANQLQTNLNDLTQNLYGTNRTATMNRLDEVKKQLATAQQTVVNLEEEGRRSRFRP